MSNTFLEGPDNKHIVTSLSQVSDQALQELRNYLEINPPSIPISSILGFGLFSVQDYQGITSTESTTSTSYVDLTTPGPTISGLPDGRYIIIYGNVSQIATAGGFAEMNLSLNGGAPVNVGVFSSVQNAMSVAMTEFVVFNSGGSNNSIQAKYASQGGSLASFAFRYITALRYANV